MKGFNIAFIRSYCDIWNPQEPLFFMNSYKWSSSCRSTIDSPPQHPTFLYSNQAMWLVGIQRRLEPVTLLAWEPGIVITRLPRLAKT